MRDPTMIVYSGPIDWLIRYLAHKHPDTTDYTIDTSPWVVQTHPPHTNRMVRTMMINDWVCALHLDDTPEGCPSHPDHIHVCTAADGPHTHTCDCGFAW